MTHSRDRRHFKRCRSVQLMQNGIESKMLQLLQGAYYNFISERVFLRALSLSSIFILHSFRVAPCMHYRLLFAPLNVFFSTTHSLKWRDKKRHIHAHVHTLTRIEKWANHDAEKTDGHRKKNRQIKTYCTKIHQTKWLFNNL